MKKKNEIFALSDRRFVKIEVILLKIQLLISLYFLLFALNFTPYFVNYLRMKLGQQDVPFECIGRGVLRGKKRKGRQVKRKKREERIKKRKGLL